jgi:hypothetical protein
MKTMIVGFQSMPVVKTYLKTDIGRSRSHGYYHAKVGYDNLIADTMLGIKKLIKDKRTTNLNR